MDQVELEQHERHAQKSTLVHDPREAARRIADGLDVPSATLETILQRLANITRSKGRREVDNLVRAGSSNVDGYACASEECADFIQGIAIKVAEGRI